MPKFILLENRKAAASERASFYFTHPVDEVLCFSPHQLMSSLDKIESLQKEGHYVVGYLSYEAGYFLESTDMVKAAYDGTFPLLYFMAFREVQALNAVEISQLLEKLSLEYPEPFLVSNLILQSDEAQYLQQIEKAKKHIFQGDTYQINYTSKYTFDTKGAPIQLYRQLRERQKVEYAAFFQCDDHHILSLSPELFFKKQENFVTTKPMKGTMPRAADPIFDEQNKARLTCEPKLIAENIIIVDLLRNDLNRFAEPGSVSVSQLLEVESFETLHQMTSTIVAAVAADTPLKTFMRHLFPCGSITGAPKRRTMQIIHALESEARRVYTGAIGYVTPSNDMCFNVAIRTLFLKNGRGELGVGGGITHDSIAFEEFQELKLKATFFTELGMSSS